MKATILLLTEEGVTTSTNVLLEMEAVHTHVQTQLVHSSAAVVKVTSSHPMEKHVKVCRTITNCLYNICWYMCSSDMEECF